MIVAYLGTRYINLANCIFTSLILNLEKIINYRSSTPYYLSIYIFILSILQFSDTYTSLNYEGVSLDTL